MNHLMQKVMKFYYLFIGEPSDKYETSVFIKWWIYNLCIILQNAYRLVEYFYIILFWVVYHKAKWNINVLAVYM